MRRRHTVTERLSLVGVIERFANGLEVYDPAFARTLAAELHALDRLDEAESIYREGLAAFEESSLRDDPGFRYPFVAGLAACQLDRGLEEQALPLLEEALALARAVYPADHPRVRECELTLERLGRAPSGGDR